MKILTTLFLSLFITLQLTAQPSGYYDAASGKTGAELKTALYNIIKGHTVKSYDYLWTAFETTDKKADGKVWDMYSNCTYTFGSKQCGNYNSECDCYNREHSWPKSWFNDASPMNSDLFHLVPTDGYVNNRRGNLPFGTVSSPTWTSANGSKVGPCSYPGYTGDVFEPVNEYKGDFARNYFYMVTRYENLVVGWNSNVAAQPVLDGTTHPSFEPWFKTLLLAWHASDPVSQKEIDRNNAVYAIQNNRNPYIDHPEYAASVWTPGAGVQPEPTTYPADFSSHNILLQWTDATGDVVPDGYLVRMSSVGFGSIPAPADGTPVDNGATDQNIAYGTRSAWFTNLSANTTYYFKLFSYTGSGSSIDYKTDGTVPQVEKTTAP